MCMEHLFTVIKNNLSVIRWWDGLDILLVSFLLYKLMQLIRESSAGQVLKGVLIFILVTQLVGIFQLNMLYYLLSQTMQIGILALVVLFQPELRRMLDSVGRSRLPSLFNGEKEGDTAETLRAIATIVDISDFMAKTKTGTLIVVERETKLGEYMKTGTILQAELSGELLKNIFFDRAPLHDGAVVIRGNKIAAAGCMLPLSTNKNLSRELGMRHRAGVGISETTDAIAVIVSEETGSISIAVGGMLKRHLSLDTMRTLLTKELVRAEDTPKKKLSLLKFWRTQKK
ncbi:MAG TPA: TIGR00159 family protein [Clostridiales bacterium]|jgi:diadenylate cyclase|nr:TIGR00159 family protein [Clostridiales bacterium]